MKHRTRQENVARKGLRLMNERKRAKAQREPSKPSRAKRCAPPPVPGERFHKLTAVESIGLDPTGNLRWVFACDCGERVTWRVSTVRSNLKSLGWCSCTRCYRAAGGWAGIKDTRKAVDEFTARQGGE